MTRERAKELLPVIQAFAEGKPIESKYNRGWIPDSSPIWHQDAEYRIKPEPREWWDVINPAGTLFGRRNSELVAREFATKLNVEARDNHYTVVHVREVID